MKNAFLNLFGENNFKIGYIISKEFTFLKFKYLNEKEKMSLIKENQNNLFKEIKEYSPELILILFMPSSFDGIFKEFIFELRHYLSNSIKIINIYDPKYATARSLGSMNTKEYIEHIKKELSLEGINI